MYPYIYCYIALWSHTLKFYPSLCKTVSCCTDALSFTQPILFASTISQALAFLHSVTVLICPCDANPCMQTVLLYFSRYSVVFFKKKKKKESKQAWLSRSLKKQSVCIASSRSEGGMERKIAGKSSLESHACLLSFFFFF